MESAIMEDALMSRFLTTVVFPWFNHSAFRKPERSTDERRKRRLPPRFNPDTGQWEDWDGTPYGAIDTLLTDDGPDGDDPGEQWGWQ